MRLLLFILCDTHCGGSERLSLWGRRKEHESVIKSHKS